MVASGFAVGQRVFLLTFSRFIFDNNAFLITLEANVLEQNSF